MTRFRGMNKNGIFYLKAFSCLIHKNWFMDDLVDIDYKDEMESNQQLRESNNDVHKNFRERLKLSTLEKRQLLLRKLWGSFCWILSASIIALAVIVFLDVTKLFTFFVSKFITVASIFCFSFATLARLGWEGQTCAGDSVFEKLDEGIFWFMYFMGTFFGVISVGI